MANSVSIRVGAPGAKQASSEIDQLRDKFTKLQSQGAKGFAIGAGAAITTKALNMVGNAIGDVTSFLGDSIDKYREQEVATGRLTSSLVQNVAGWDGSTKAMNAAEEAGIKLGFTNTETANSLALLLAATHNQADALKLLAGAQDLARFKGISLAEASSALTTIEAGRARGLAALGINVKDYATTAERLAAVEKIVGGQASKFAASDLGQVDVALAKVDAAQEKFGKGLSKLEVSVLPALGDALGAVADQVNGLQTALDHSATRGDKARADIEGLRHSILNVTGALDDWLNSQEALPGKLDAADAAIARSTHGGDQWQQSIEGMTTAATTFHDALTAMGGRQTESLESYLKRIASEAATAKGKIAGLVSEIEDHLFKPASLKGQRADVLMQIQDLQKQLNGTPATYGHFNERASLKGQIADLQSNLLDLDGQIAASKGPAALQAWLDSSKTKFKNTDKAAFDLVTQLEALYKAAGMLPAVKVTVSGVGATGGGTGTGYRQFAGGGVIQQGMKGTVGEEGIEDFEAKNGVVKITPRRHALSSNDHSGGGSGGGLTIIVQGVSVLTPGAAEALGRQLAPIVTRAQQRMGHISPARAF